MVSLFVRPSSKNPSYLAVMLIPGSSAFKVSVPKRGNSTCLHPPPSTATFGTFFGGGGYLFFTGARSYFLLRSPQRAMMIPGPSSFPPQPFGTHTGPRELWDHSESAAQLTHVQQEASCEARRLHCQFPLPKMSGASTQSQMKDWLGCGHRWIPEEVSVLVLKVSSYGIYSCRLLIVLGEIGAPL